MSATDNSMRQDVQDLYSHHHGWLLGWLRRRLGCKEQAADLAQDAFLRLVIKPRTFDSHNSARAYLSTVARNLCVDFWRRREIERAWLEALASRPESVEPSLEDRAVILETLYEIDAMLRRLPMKVSNAFVLAQVHGMRYRDIAVHLGVSERMVKKYLAQAMLHCVLLETGRYNGV